MIKYATKKNFIEVVNQYKPKKRTGKIITKTGIQSSNTNMNTNVSHPPLIPIPELDLKNNKIHNKPDMRNPAAQRAKALGLDYRIINTPSGQQGQVYFKGKWTDAWDWYRNISVVKRSTNTSRFKFL